MSTRAIKLSFAGLLGLTLIWLMVGSILFVTAGELSAAPCDENCDGSCEESCQDCSDCALCLPSFIMIAWDGFDVGPVDSAPGWTVGSLPTQTARDSSEDIDHPPQNLL